GDRDLGAKGGFGHGNRNGAVDMVPFTREVRMLADFRDYIEIPRRPAHNACMPFSGDFHARARIDARRNANLHGLRLRHSAFAPADPARRAASPRPLTFGADVFELQL